MISRKQALAAGMSGRSIDRRVASGEWRRVHRGVYRSSAFERTWRQELIAAQLHLGEGAVVSHRAATALLGLEGVEPGFLEFTSASPREASDPRLVVHTSDTLCNGDTAKLGPFRVTTVARTLIDLGAVACEETVEIAMHDALRRGLTSVERLRQRLESLRGRGRRGTRTMHVLIEKQPIRPTKSWMEVKLLRLIRSAKLPMPIPQFEVREGDFLAFFDFAYPDQKLGIEGDSVTFHSQPFDLENDIARRNELTRLGWRVRHVTRREIIEDPKGVAESIRALLDLS